MLNCTLPFRAFGQSGSATSTIRMSKIEPERSVVGCHLLSCSRVRLRWRRSRPGIQIILGSRTLCLRSGVAIGRVASL